jgi:hypothetical protein
MGQGRLVRRPIEHRLGLGHQRVAEPLGVVDHGPHRVERIVAVPPDKARDTSTPFAITVRPLGTVRVKL